MSFFKAYTNLSSKTRIGFGVAVIAWGAVGLWMSDKAEEKYKPSEKDRAALVRMTPTIHSVDRDEKK